ncbi:MAG: TIGR02584 family CRISPR-associated protein [Syntrophobacterales bacterium CG_4_8_14_3_um_filter_58_8]|nr:MAG: TIGR02584 family CRISPR-associated protein [Syntrophobacterales bacterium CG03_land_8_20_14_0_80_58_14]PJC76425.1 MAG: TIGR02584 family CRISPR-associated protein [Syntrophobacterales bacterium CG_4_8_14_3_um_filter_58_8]
MKNILLAVVGLSPQVVTETLYALHQQGRRVDAIHLITTREGKEAVLASILSPRDGYYRRYLAEYGIDPATIAFGFENVHTVMDDLGNEIGDIESEEENEWLLRRCLELTFRFTADPDTAVFFSIAGGRKTMSACLMLAAELYGRPQDRVYHVLVSPEFESSRDFFYPPQESVAVELWDRNNQSYRKETRYVRVNLVPIPFVSIRNQLAGDLLREPKDPATLMMNLVREEPVRLTIDLPAGKVIYRGRELDMMPARLALYTFFALRKKECQRLAGPSEHEPSRTFPRPEREKIGKNTSDIVSCRGCAECYLDFQGISDRQREITELYRKAAADRELTEMSDSGILGLTAENFNSYKGKIRKNLERGFGAQDAARLAIVSVGRRPDTRYGLGIDREKIRVVF